MYASTNWTRVQKFDVCLWASEGSSKEGNKSSVDNVASIAYNAIGNIKRKAEPQTDFRVVQDDRSVIEMIIWKLPDVTPERPHGYKYRLNYSQGDGTTLVRYDNKLGKGDHKHIKGTEFPYVFSTPEQAVIDFLEDVERNGGHIG